MDEPRSEHDPAWICACGLPMSRNPHPDAGDPTMLGLTVGHTWVCIPCTVKSRHDWAARAHRAEGAIRDARAAINGDKPWSTQADFDLDRSLAPLWAVLSGRTIPSGGES